MRHGGVRLRVRSRSEGVSVPRGRSICNPCFCLSLLCPGARCRSRKGGGGLSSPLAHRPAHVPRWFLNRTTPLPHSLLQNGVLAGVLGLRALRGLPATSRSFQLPVVVVQEAWLASWLASWLAGGAILGCHAITTPDRTFALHDAIHSFKSLFLIYNEEYGPVRTQCRRVCILPAVQCAMCLVGFVVLRPPGR